MKKFICLFVCAVLCLSLAACQPPKTGDDDNNGKDPVVDDPNNKPGDGGDTQTPNPYVDSDDLAGASGIAGFEFDAPSTVNELSGAKYRAIKDNMIEVMYGDDTNSITLRKGVGSEDVSGDTTTYADTKTTAVNGKTVTLRGTGGKYVLATWTTDGYSYSIRANYAGAGLDEATMTSILKDTVK